MGRSTDQPTSQTLLGRLREDPSDPAAWAEFVDRYGHRILGWCRKYGLQEADAQDVTQTVLLKLADKMRSFVYDPTLSFHGWLKTLTHHAWRDFLQSRRRAGLGDESLDSLDLLSTIEARDDLNSRLAEEYDRERLETAMFRVQLRVQPQTWEAFRRHAIEGESGSGAALATGLSVAAVFAAKSRILAMIREEIARLEGAGPN